MRSGGLWERDECILLVEGRWIIRTQRMDCCSQLPRWHPIIHTHVLPFYIAPGFFCVIEYGRSGVVSLLRFVYKGHCGLCLVLSLLDPSLWGKPTALLWAALWRRPHGKKLKPPAKSRENELGIGFSSPVKFSKTTKAPANIMMETSWEIVSQNYPA